VSIQAAHVAEAIGPLGEDELLFRRMSGEEALGRLYSYRVELYGANPDIKLSDVLGKGIAVRLTRGDDQPRYFHGIVTEFARGGTAGRYTRYFATLHPALWLLTRQSNCRIFQEMTAPAIIKELLREVGEIRFEEALFGNYRSRPYCVQYRETTFNFISRLMEEEGIYYYFEHAKDGHTLVLADSVSSHEAAPGYATVPYARASADSSRPREQFFSWSRKQTIIATDFSLTDFDFEKPKADLLVTSIASPAGGSTGHEVFDYPGRFLSIADGQTYARTRMEEKMAQHDQAEGFGNPRGLGVGQLFSLTEHPCAEDNREYLVTGASYELDGGEVESRGTSGRTEWSCRLSMLDSKTPFRPARSTPTPVVQGPQTAIVTGDPSSEIWTDQHGRVKVQFPWDRYGNNDEKSSCWIRVSHSSAGLGWGSVQIPRVGQEVIVSFLEGDPDSPIITGRVYNQLSKPPFELPGKGMVSGMKSSSTPGGGGYNEISMDDTSGSERIVIHGQYDMETTVENDEQHTVLNNRTRSVSVNETVSIGANASRTVGANMSLEVASAKTEKVGATSSLTVAAAYDVTVGGLMNETIGGLLSQEVGAAKTVSVGAVSSESVGGNKSTSAGGSIKSSASKNFEVSAGQDVQLSSKKKTIVKAEGELMVDGQKKGVIKIKDELTLKVGSASITLKKNGDIIIKGAKINIKGSKDVVIKGSKVLNN